MVMLTCVTAVGLTGAALIPACTARAIAHEQMQNGGNVPWHRTRSLCRPLSATQSPYQIIYSLFFLSLSLCAWCACFPVTMYSCFPLPLSLFLDLKLSILLFHCLSFFFLSFCPPLSFSLPFIDLSCL